MNDYYDRRILHSFFGFKTQTHMQNLKQHVIERS